MRAYTGFRGERRESIDEYMVDVARGPDRVWRIIHILTAIGLAVWLVASMVFG